MHKIEKTTNTHFSKDGKYARKEYDSRLPKNFRHRIRL